MSNTVGELMSKVPVTIPDDLTLTDARQRMFDHNIRHLPITRDDRLVGIVTERDIALVTSIPTVDADKVLTNQAMQDNPYTCAPGDRIKDVATTMLEHKYGAAIVMEDQAIVGMFTTIDALRELIHRLD